MKPFEIVGLPPDELNAFLSATHPDPFRILGPHRVGDDLAIRIFRPDAQKVEILTNGDSAQPIEAEKIHSDGFFCARIPAPAGIFPYRVRLTSFNDNQWTTADTYRYGPIMGEMDLYLFSEGQHWRLFDKFGAHLRTIDGDSGVYFAVWAPNAQRVSVVGDFNGWDGRVHPMRKLLGSGVWEIFIPGVQENAHYKFEIRTPQGALLLKSDPFAFFNQHGRSTSSLVYNLKRYKWSDADWMEARPKRDWPKSAISIYEVHLGSWRRRADEGNRHLSYLELAETLVPYVVDMGYTHIELMPIAEHPFEGSWGYQVTDYYAPTSRFGNPDEFRYFVDRCHQAGIGVILDWVPAHFPKDAHGLAEFDGTDLYEHTDPRQGEHQDWGTLIFNYGRNEVRNFLIANALVLAGEISHRRSARRCGRVDALSRLLTQGRASGSRTFMAAAKTSKRFISSSGSTRSATSSIPGIMTIAEETTAWPGVSRPTYLGGLGFGFKWNMGWMHDFLELHAAGPDLPPVSSERHHLLAALRFSGTFHPRA